MLTKDQALATMDVHLIRQASESRRRLERRASRLSIAYPALRRVPLEDRLDLLEAAQKYARRQWTTYALLLPVFGALSFLLMYEPIGGSIPAPVFVISSIVLARAIVYIHVRAHLDGLVASMEHRESRHQRC